MTERELLDSRLAALCLMKASLENRAAKTEICIARRGFSDPDEAEGYLTVRSLLRATEREMRVTLADMSKAVRGEPRDGEVEIYDDAVTRAISVEELTDELAAEIEKVRACSTLSERIKLFKEREKLTDRQISALSGLSVGTVRKYRSGKASSVSLDNLEKMARALGVEPAVLAGWEWEK